MSLKIINKNEQEKIWISYTNWSVTVGGGGGQYRPFESQ
jgi:hypothetical protein